VKNTLRDLNTPGGRTLVLLAIFVLGLGAEMLRIPYAKEIVIATLGALLGRLKE
jgi:hypothetical protein